MGRPALSGSDRSTREKVGKVLRRLREEQPMTLADACRYLGSDVTRARLWGVERGTLPYSGLLVRLASLYEKPSEAIIEQATGQSSLNLLLSLFTGLAEVISTRHPVTMEMTLEEEVIVRSCLDLLRYREVMGPPAS